MVKLQDKKAEKKVLLVSLVKTWLSKVIGTVLDPEVLHIIRPFVYVLLVSGMKNGRHSWFPIKVSLALDGLTILMVVLKLVGKQKLRTIERRDLTSRNWMSLLKYLLRDPIFETFTLRLLMKIFHTLRIPQALFGIVLSILNYYRYYIYIA